MNLKTPIEAIPRVGPQYQKKLKKLGIETVEDLLFHFPHRYEDFSNLITTSSAENKVGETVCLQAKIKEIRNIRIFKRNMVITEAQVEDSTGKIAVTWFNQPYLINTLKPGDSVFLAGKVAVKNSKKYLSSPSYEKILGEPITNSSYDSTHIGRLVPVYPETEGLSSRWLRFIIKPILSELGDKIPETLPTETIKQNKLLGINQAIKQIHFPDSTEQAELAKKRFAFQELFNLSLAILRKKAFLARQKTNAVTINLPVIKKFVDSLPFKLTPDQKKCSWRILKDMEKERPMNRLLNGDVGSGKTVVAAIAILNTAKAGCQAVLMAPTEILAKQHFKTIGSLFSKFHLKIGLVTGKESFLGKKKIKRKDLAEKVKNGEVDVLIGTHALIQETTTFKKLALAVVDEQHRFGTKQRMKLARKQGISPHFLSMSATPIPRTLALTLYGDLDLCLIKEVPQGRKKIITKIVPPKKRDAVYQFIKKEILAGKQAFVICPRIDSSEEPLEQNLLGESRISSWTEVKNVKQEYQKLSKEIFPDLKIEMLHGRMKTEEKEKILESFRKEKTNILVSTSLVEVGVDFPNANIMLIEGADKFGLAQLHQFRGRVGRGDSQAYCFLFSQFPGNPRLKAMVSSRDGFELAEKDLKLRGPGDLAGQKQWGLPDFVMASLKDIELVEKARSAAKEIINRDPDLRTFPELKEKADNFQKKVHLE